MSPAKVRRGPADPTVAVAYLRVSTEDQALGPRAQRDAIERWAKANGVRVVAVHEDKGISGGAPIEDRPGLLAAIDALGAHGAGVLVVAKRDRLARDLIIGAMIERLAERANATIVSADGAGNGVGPEAMLMRSIIDAFSQYERALIRSRTKSALAVKRGRGERISGRPPLGYAFDADARLVPVATEQKVVERVRGLHASGLSMNEIARRLNDERVPSRGERWYASSIARIVRPPART